MREELLIFYYVGGEAGVMKIKKGNIKKKT
jgi:hypothetical protein